MIGLVLVIAALGIGFALGFAARGITMQDTGRHQAGAPAASLAGALSPAPQRPQSRAAWVRGVEPARAEGPQPWTTAEQPALTPEVEALLKAGVNRHDVDEALRLLKGIDSDAAERDRYFGHHEAPDPYAWVVTGERHALPAAPGYPCCEHCEGKCAIPDVHEVRCADWHSPTWNQAPQLTVAPELARGLIA